MSKLLGRAALGWFGLFCLAFVNGALREVGLKAGLGIQEPLAHQLSCLTGVTLWTAFAWLIWDRLKITRLKDAAVVGLLWFVATMLFETFVLNRNLTWAEVLHTYDVTAGEFWGLVLLWIGILPVVLFMIRTRWHD